MANYCRLQFESGHQIIFKPQDVSCIERTVKGNVKIHFYNGLSPIRGEMTLEEFEQLYEFLGTEPDEEPE